LGEVVAEGILNAVLLEAEEVVAMVQAQLPDGYPMDLAEAILQGMLRQLKRLKPM
jgi:serine/threonine-protein kinase HipA